jgi:hypothetical protein
MNFIVLCRKNSINLLLVMNEFFFSHEIDPIDFYLQIILLSPWLLKKKNPNINVIKFSLNEIHLPLSWIESSWFWYTLLWLITAVFTTLTTTSSIKKTERFLIVDEPKFNLSQKWITIKSVLYTILFFEKVNVYSIKSNIYISKKITEITRSAAYLNNKNDFYILSRRV